MSKILIIEDELPLRETLMELLSFSGYDVYEAENGLEGLKAIKKVAPDLIICDIMMPVMDGHGFMKLHNESDYAHIAVLFLSAVSEDGNQQEGITENAKKIIRKPFVFKELKNLIEYHLH